MKKTDFDKALERLVCMMENGEVCLGAGLPFGEVCVILGVPEDGMDKFLYDSFGVSGGEILDVFRRRVPLCML